MVVRFRRGIDHILIEDLFCPFSVDTTQTLANSLQVKAIEVYMVCAYKGYGEVIDHIYIKEKVDIVDVDVAHAINMMAKIVEATTSLVPCKLIIDQKYKLQL